MITGFNTDVKHKAKVYHVQTEDKGRNNPKVETLVYMGGEILDSFRTSYDADRSTLSEDEIISMMESQHKNVIRSIKVGHYDDAEDFPSDVVTDRSLDEVIRTYLENEQPLDPIQLAVKGDFTLEPGHATSVSIKAATARGKEPIDGVMVRAKLISPKEKPLLLFKGRTDVDGELTLDLDLPTYVPGETTLIIQAISDQGTAEYRRDL